MINISENGFTCKFCSTDLSQYQIQVENKKSKQMLIEFMSSRGNRVQASIIILQVTELVIVFIRRVIHLVFI